MKPSAPKQRGRHREQHDERIDETLVLRREHEEDEDEAEREDQRAQLPGRDLVELQSRPLVSSSPAGMHLCAIWSIAWIASPEPWPGAALPLISMFR